MVVFTEARNGGPMGYNEEVNHHAIVLERATSARGFHLHPYKILCATDQGTTDEE